MKNYKEYTSIKKAIKREYAEQLKRELQAIKDKSREELLGSWWCRELLTKKQQEQKTSDIKKILSQKTRAKNEKDISKAFDLCDRVANAEPVHNITCSVEWVRSRTWGSNPHAETYANGMRTTGTASGCGYDKLSSAIAQSFNANLSILKVLYNSKEKALRKNPNTSSRDALGYGSGYGVAPYFEGGVGFSCFRSIFERVGARVTWHDGKTYDHIIIEF